MEQLQGTVVLALTCVRCGSREARLSMSLPIKDDLLGRESVLDPAGTARVVLLCANDDCDHLVDYGDLPVEEPPKGVFVR
jgi:hypothetical protein